MKTISKTNIEQYVINIVKAKRQEFGFSQAILAELLDVSPGFIGKVESIKHLAKYNLNHINSLSKIFNCSPKDFLPFLPFEDHGNRENY